MKLEILSRYPYSPQPGAPRLLFVHGICVGAWVWDAHFLPWFAQAGFEAHALSLRGHGGSEGADRIDDWRLADYSADLRQAVAQLDAAAGASSAPLVVIGHSLGGAVVQDWLRLGGKAQGVALLASVPPWGLAASAWRMALDSPALFREMARLGRDPSALDPAVLRAGLFSADLPDEAWSRFARRVGGESRQAGIELQGWRPFAPMPWQAPPMFVLGGQDDRFIGADAVRGTAAYYGTGSQLVPHLAHALMLDTRWEAPARMLADWLRRRFPAPGAAS